MFIDKKMEVPQDWDAVAQYLGRRGFRFDHEAGVKQFASGIANLNYLIFVDGRLAVFRRPPSGDFPPGAYDFARQFKIQSRLGRFLPAVALGLMYCDDLSVIGVPFLISEYRPGIAISRTLPEQLGNIENVGGKLSRLMLESLVQLHRISPEEADLADLGQAEGFLERQIYGWYKRASRVMSEDQMEKVTVLKDWFVANQPCESPSSLVHLDYKLDNVLIDPETLCVQGIVDWEMSTIGDSIYDLVLMLVLWGEPEDNPVYERLCCMPCTSPGWWNRRHVIECYRQEMGLEISEPDIKFYWLLALYRTFIAAAQLTALYEREEMPNASTVDMPTVVNTTLGHAAALINQTLDW